MARSRSEGDRDIWGGFWRVGGFWFGPFCEGGVGSGWVGGVVRRICGAVEGSGE